MTSSPDILLQIALPDLLETLREFDASDHVIDRLDRRLRTEALNALGGSTDDGPIRDALALAAEWARVKGREDWRTRWSYLLGVLRDAARASSYPSQLGALISPSSRAAEVLAAAGSSDATDSSFWNGEELGRPVPPPPEPVNPALEPAAASVEA